MTPTLCAFLVMRFFVLNLEKWLELRGVRILRLFDLQHWLQIDHLNLRITIAQHLQRVFVLTSEGVEE